MNREIKFRCWDGEQMVSPDYIDREGRGYWKSNSIPVCSGVNSPDALMQYTGLKDKNGVEIYEGDILRLIFKAGEEKDNFYTDAAYSVQPLDYEGFHLSARSMMSEDTRNQYPVHNSPSFRYRSLTTDSQNGNYDHLAVAETWGENTLHRHTWQQTHYSNDVTVIGNIYANPDLLEPTA